MIAFVFYSAALVAILSLSLLLPVLVAFGFGEHEVGVRLIIYAALGAFLSVATLLSIRGFVGSLGRIASIYLCVAAWLGLPMLLAIPFGDILQLSYLDALFETISGFTTTGASILPSIDNIPRAMVVARAELQWIGGLATLLTFILILSPSSIGGIPHTDGTTVGSAVMDNPSTLGRYCRGLAQIYLALTIFCFVLLLINGSQPFDALVLSMTAISSGGFLPGDKSLHDSLSLGGMLVMTLFLLIAATSVFWHQMAMRLQLAELKTHRESYFVLLVWLVAGLVFSVVIFQAAGGASRLPTMTALVEGLYNSASTISTSGLQSRPGIYALLPPTLILALLFLGAGCFSTSSGLKFFRLGGMVSQAVHELNVLIYPHGIRPVRFGSVAYNNQLMKSIWGMFMAAVIVVVIGAIMLTYYGMNFQAGFTASIASFVNAGPAYGPEWAPQSEQGWPSYPEMITPQKIIISALMLLGRLEVILLVVAFNLSFWINR